MTNAHSHRSIMVIDWRGYSPPPYDPAKHDPCERCGFRVRWWTHNHPKECTR
jgi:hypothetical protein